MTISHFSASCLTFSPQFARKVGPSAPGKYPKFRISSILFLTYLGFVVEILTGSNGFGSAACRITNDLDGVEMPGLWIGPATFKKEVKKSVSGFMMEQISVL